MSHQKRGRTGTGKRRRDSTSGDQEVRRGVGLRSWDGWLWQREGRYGEHVPKAGPRHSCCRRPSPADVAAREGWCLRTRGNGDWGRRVNVKIYTVGRCFLTSRKDWGRFEELLEFFFSIFPIKKILGVRLAYSCNCNFSSFQKNLR